MRFNSKARLDRGQVQNRRGRTAVPGGIKVGGGIGGVLVVLLVVVLSQVLGDGSGLPGGSGGGAPGDIGTSDGTLTQCRTGADANRDADCARLAVVNSVQDYWEDALPQQAGRRYVPADTVVFTGQVSSACGIAGSSVGPFYCPADRQVYLDTTFFRDMLQGRLGGRGGDFAEAYVLAHEYGHHVQNLLGVMARVQSRQGATSDAVRLELQADCYAGMWSRFATSTEDAAGRRLITELTRQDIAEAVDAARAVGDDRIQRRSGGRVQPDAWTHGSAEQRMRWFMTGRERGTLEACDTFAARDL